MMAIFAAWSSGITLSTESTCETEGRRSKASCLRRSSSRVTAEERALKPDRPVVARMRFSQATDSVPFAWRLSTL